MQTRLCLRRSSSRVRSVLCGVASCPIPKEMWSTDAVPHITFSPTIPAPRPHRARTKYREVRLALSDDFDTPRAVRHLASLCALISPHLKELTQGDLGPITAAAKFTAETLSLLGVGSSLGGTATAGAEGGLGGSGGAGAGLGDDGLAPTREVVDAMVEFRRLVRKAVLGRNLTKNLGSAKPMKRCVRKKTQAPIERFRKGGKSREEAIQRRRGG